MRRIVAYLLGMVALSLLGCIVVLLVAPRAHAQVTDRPILKLPSDPSLVAIDINALEQRACAVWWARDPDPYGDWNIDKAFCRGVHCAGITTDLPKMLAARTENVKREDVAACIAKLPDPPPAAWIVAPITSGQRPAYLLKPDGTRGAQSGYAKTTIVGADKTVPMWCNCKKRSKETTSSTYCTWADWKLTSNPAEPVRVTLCKRTT